ncbi:NACHT C-terminal helical domain 2-containing protein [Nostoc sp.]|uniref:NACHT C-terminal helical domain 2-containing protein n=1 Tax=Nostoc sp. TaxID=1180 RepID=UPI003FA601D5
MQIEYKNLNTNQSEEQFPKWWKENRDYWCKQIKLVVSNYRNICHDWQFSEAQQELLFQYYDANVLLMDCLASDCYLSCEVRQEIENSLLLPISELKFGKTKGFLYGE